MPLSDNNNITIIICYCLEVASQSLDHTPSEKSWVVLMISLHWVGLLSQNCVISIGFLNEIFRLKAIELNPYR